MWPRGAGGSGTRGLSAHAKDDREVLVGDFNALHQRSDDITAHLPVRIGQPVTDLSGKCLYLPHQQPQLMECAGFLALTLQRFLEVGDALAQTADARRKFVFGDETFGIAVDEASEPLVQLA